MKADNEENYIRQVCRVKFSHYTTEEKQYHYPRQCDIAAEDVIDQSILCKVDTEGIQFHQRMIWKIARNYNT